MKYPKVKKEHLEHKKLLKMLSNHFGQDEHEMEEDEHGYDSDELFERDGFGDPMDTFVEEGDTRQNHENNYDDEGEFEDNDNGDYDDGDDTNDDADMDRPHKDDRKKMSIMMLSKKIGKNKSKAMQML